MWKETLFSRKSKGLKQNLNAYKEVGLFKHKQDTCLWIGFLPSDISEENLEYTVCIC